jgi:arginyl-tRNA synthetase
MAGNLFDSIDGVVAGETDAAPWAARSPFRPEPGRDLMLVPRVREWFADPVAREALERIAADPAVAEVREHDKGVDVRLADDWIEARGEPLESGAAAPDANSDLAADARYAVYFWGANTTKALHIGHLRNLALGNAIAAALRVGGARVENRSLICDVGRSMGEAMAGVVASGRADDELGAENGEKSDHFVGLCYSEYVQASRQAVGDDGADDSVARESAVYDDKADELMMRVLAGDQRALELWSKTRAWVISGQRKTLSRLGVPFDKVIFESDFLPEVAELTNLGLREGTLRRREDGMVFYPTQREELEEMPLVRSDGLPTQHMRALAYWSAAPELDDFTSLQVCGTEWVAHVTCRRQLLDALALAPSNGHPNPVANGNGRGGPPTHDVFHGMVARSNEAVSSSKEGALLIDNLVEWAEEQMATDPGLAAVRAAHPQPDRVAARIVLAYFLLQTTSKRVEFEPELLFEPERSLGWDIVVAQAQRSGTMVGAGAAIGSGAADGVPTGGSGAGGMASLGSSSSSSSGGSSGSGAGEGGASDPDYRFAVVQAELFRRHLRSAVVDLDPVPLARYLSHFARWYGAEERSPRVEAVAQAVLDEGVRGLGLEAA